MIPLSKFKIAGNSMNPTFKPGDVVLVNRFSYIFSKPKINDLVVLKRDLPVGKAGKYIIKRITKTKDKEFFVVGDNKKESADSRKFGWVNKKEIVGKVIHRISNS